MNRSARVPAPCLRRVAPPRPGLRGCQPMHVNSWSRLATGERRRTVRQTPEMRLDPAAQACAAGAPVLAGRSARRAEGRTSLTPTPRASKPASIVRSPRTCGPAQRQVLTADSFLSCSASRIPCSTEDTRTNASTTAGSKCVPLPLRMKAVASSCFIAA
jgi:hypothetical protein